MKKVVLLLVLIMLFSFAGCTDNEETNSVGATSGTETQVQNLESEVPKVFKRLESVTIYEDGALVGTYPVQWYENSCEFSNSQLDETVMGISYDTESRNLSAIRLEDVESSQDTDSKSVVNFLGFDENGYVNCVKADIVGRNEDMPVTYDKDGTPQGAIVDMMFTELDTENKTFTCSRGFSSTTNPDGFSWTEKDYGVYTYDEKGNVSKVDYLTKTEYANGVVEDKIKENVCVYTYDDMGNLIRYEEEDYIAEFTYSDEYIAHNWERIIPLFYADDETVYFVAPLLWKLS